MMPEIPKKMVKNTLHMGRILICFVIWCVLVQARQHMENGSVPSIFYPEMEFIYNQQALTDFVRVALCCVEPSGSKRPTMHEVYLQLEAIYRNVVPLSPPGLVTLLRAPSTPLERVTNTTSLITRSL